MMNPLLAAFLGNVFRFLLTFLASWLIQQGVINPDEAEKYIAGAVAALIALAWGLYQKHRTRIVIQTAIAAPPDATEAEVRLMAKER
jgi:predicted benzoate:H+ symporter BenE